MADVKKSFCHLCLAECGIKVTVDDNKIIKISPDFDDPVSQGYVCEKSQKLIGYQHSSDRITSPLKKINGTFVPISWDQAIDEISTKLKPYIDSNSIMYMAPLSPSYFANTDYSYELMSMLGVNFVSNVLSTEKAYTVLTHQYFFKSTVVPLRTEAQTTIIIGQNPWITQHYPRARTILNDIKNNPMRQLIVIDPVETETAKIANYHLKLKPGTDAWLLSALIKLLIETGGVDYKFINEHTLNFNKIQEHFAKINLDDYAKICGISIDNLVQLANIIKTSKSVAVDMGNGICHGLFSFADNYLIALLYLITGNYQKTGGMQSFNSLFIPQNYMEGKHTPTTNQMQLHGAMPAPLISNNLNFKCVIIDNCNPSTRLPNIKKFKQSLAAVELVIALDSFRSDSTADADYVLPTPTFLERYECVNSVHPDNKVLQLSTPAVVPPSYAKTTNEIYELILEKLNLIDKKLVNQLIDLYQTNHSEFYNSLIELASNKTPILYYVLRQTIGVNYQTPILSIVWSWLLKYNLRDYKLVDAVVATDKLINTLDKNNIVQIDTSTTQNHLIDIAPQILLATLKLSEKRLSDSEYKFVLQCGYRQKSSLNEVIKNTNDPILEINIDDALAMNLVDNEQVSLKTKLTELKIKCKLVNNMQSGLLRVSNHSVINQLTVDDNVDYLSPQYKFVFANIRKI